MITLLSGMDAIIELSKLNIIEIFIGIFIIIFAIVAIHTVIGKLSLIVGKPLKWVKNKNEDHILLLETAKNLNVLQQKQSEDMEQFNANYEAIRGDLKELTNMFVDKQIDDMRTVILDFASALSGGRNCNKEQFDHVMDIYQKYEKILSENNLTNGQVKVSMEVINEIYKEKLKNGDFNEEG